MSLKQAIICRPFSCAKALRGVCTTAARGLAFMQIQPRSRAKGELLCLRRQRKAHIQGKGDRWMDGGHPLASSPVVTFQVSPFEQHYLRGGKKSSKFKGPEEVAATNPRTLALVVTALPSVSLLSVVSFAFPVTPQTPGTSTQCTDVGGRLGPPTAWRVFAVIAFLNLALALSLSGSFFRSLLLHAVILMSQFNPCGPQCCVFVYYHATRCSS